MGHETTRTARLPRVTDEDIESCRTGDALVRALAVLGLVGADGEGVICPECGKAGDFKKFSVKPDGGFKHFGSDGCWGGKGVGINLLMAKLEEGKPLPYHPLGLSFPDAVRVITGKPTSVPVPIPDKLPNIEIKTFKATIDPEIYQGILNFGRNYNAGEGLAAAKEFYGQWHISPEVVEASGAVYITNPKALSAALLQRYRLPRLLECGVFTMVKRKDSDEEQPYCLISSKWPVIEPARDAAGKVVNLQFRASNAQYARYLAHKEGKLPYEGNQKFLNVRGVDPGAIGMDEIAQLPEGSQVFIVEGFKDKLSGMTMGGSAYLGWPGTGYRPSAEEIEILKRLKLVLMLDGDEAGQRAINGVYETDPDGTLRLIKPGMLHWLAERGVTDVHRHELNGDMDITDHLVARNARNGCVCPACTDMRARLAQ